MEFGGWTSVGAPCVDHRWLAVRDGRVPALELTAVHDIHIWCRRHIEYRPDGMVDSWAQPFETFGRREGDCEDIALLERALIIAAGYPSSSMWLVLLFDTITREDHAVLVFQKFMLDSRSDRISYAASAKNYKPIIAFNDARAVTFGRRV